MRLTRRGFLQTSGGAAALGAAGCKALEKGYPEQYHVEKPPVPGGAHHAEGAEVWVKSACLQCPGGCGIEVRVVEGRAVRIKGNRAYPTNRGGLCPKGVNGLQVLYDPDRIQTPLERTGERGAGGWRPITWDAAIARVAKALGELRGRGAPHELAVIGGRYRGHMRGLVRRFLAAYGSPNDLDHESICVTADEVARELTQGVRARSAYDWERAKYVVTFGAGLCESFRPTAMMLRVFGHLRQGTPERAKLVHVDPRGGISAQRADEWVQLRPGTDAALALGLAHVLVRDNLYDEAFVRDRTLGFDEWTDAAGRKRAGFKQVVERWTPAAAADVTGVPAATIERLAREMAAHRPAIAVPGRGAAAHANGLYNVLAIEALNALLGGIDAPGGVLVQREPPFAPWPDLELDATAQAGAARPRIDLAESPPLLAHGRLADLAARLESGRPYPLGALLFYYSNPLFSAPDPARLRAALGKVPLLVSFSPFLDETTAHCDLVLPDHTYLERWQLDVVPPSVGYPVFAIRQPAVEPRHDTRSTGEVFLKLAQAIGGPLAAAFPETELDVIKERVAGVQAAGRGSIQNEDFDAFWDELLAAGGWWDGPYEFGKWDEVLRTPSGKYELFCTDLDEKLGAAARAAAGEDSEAARAAVLASMGVAARGDEACLPHYEPVPPPAGAELPFALVSYKTMTHAEGRGGNQPNLQELYGVQFDRAWEAWVEIHPDDAAARGIADGEPVWLSSPAGRVKLTALLTDAAQRGVVNVPFEYGHAAYGRWAAGRGESVNPLVPAAEDRLVGQVAWYDTRVDVTKA